MNELTYLRYNLQLQTVKISQEPFDFGTRILFKTFTTRIYYYMYLSISVKNHILSNNGIDLRGEYSAVSLPR